MKQEDIQAGVGTAALVIGLLRGKPIAEAQAAAQVAAAAVGPLARELAPKLEELLRQRRERGEQATRCRVRGCVLGAGHRSEENPYCQDEHGTLFQEA